MVHDSLCIFKVKSQLKGQLKKGQIKIINIKCDGILGDIETFIDIDGVKFSAKGLIGNYLL